MLDDGAGFYLMVKPIAPLEKQLYATIEYPNPADPAHPLINDAEHSPTLREYQLSSPDFIPISESPDSIVFEWSCQNPPSLHELRRLAGTPKGIFLLSYGKKAARMTPEERQTWLAILQSAVPVD